MAEMETGRQRATTLLVLPGDGIGPEIVAATVEVLEAADRRIVVMRHRAEDDTVRLLGPFDHGIGNRGTRLAE